MKMFIVAITLACMHSPSAKSMLRVYPGATGLPSQVGQNIDTQEVADPFLPVTLPATDEAILVKTLRDLYTSTRSFRMGYEGTAVVRFIVGKDGSISEVTVDADASSGHKDLDDAAIKAIATSVYSPAIDANGKAVACRLQRPVTFRQASLQKDSTEQLDELIDELFFDDHPDRNLRSRSPQLKVSYGVLDFHRKGLKGELTPVINYGAAVGTEDARSIRSNQSIVRYQNNGVFFNYGAAQSIAGMTPEDDVIVNSTSTSMNLYSFGTIDESGYGYKLGDGGALKFLVAKHSIWTSIDPISYDSTISEDARQTVRDFMGNIRFGATMSPTIEFQVIKPLSIRASYTWTQVYPRHMFWYWAGSELIEGIADGIVMASVKAFGKASPASLPIMNFVLRNAVAYGFKALRHEKMNWPFETAAPLNVIGYNVGVSLNF